MRLIMNADDFGYTKGVSDGIIDAYLHGIVSSTTAMCNMPDIVYAAALSKQHPQLGVGLHLTLSAGKPLTTGVSLVNQQGLFHKEAVLFTKNLKCEEVEEEFHAQLLRFIDVFGKEPTHLDSHHLIHEHPFLLPIVMKLAKQYELPVRGHSAFLFSSEFYDSAVSVDGLLAIWERNKTVQGLELMCHPAFCDEELLAKSSYAQKRERERVVLCDERLRTRIMELGIELVTYAKEF